MRRQSRDIRGPRAGVSKCLSLGVAELGGVVCSCLEVYYEVIESGRNTAVVRHLVD